MTCDASENTARRGRQPPSPDGMAELASSGQGLPPPQPNLGPQESPGNRVHNMMSPRSGPRLHTCWFDVPLWASELPNTTWPQRGKPKIVALTTHGPKQVRQSIGRRRSWYGRPVPLQATSGAKPPGETYTPQPCAGKQSQLSRRCSSNAESWCAVFHDALDRRRR